MGVCQNYGPFLGPPNTRRRIILRTQKGTIVLTTTHMDLQPQDRIPKQRRSLAAGCQGQPSFVGETGPHKGYMTVKSWLVHVPYWDFDQDMVYGHSCMVHLLQ